MKKLTTLILILTALLLPCLSLAADDMWENRLPSGLTEIGPSAFEGDTSLDRVYVGDNVQTIGALAFANTCLRYIRLPESLTEIAPDAFLNVPHVEVYGAWNADLFAGMDNVSQSGAALPINTTSSHSIAAGQEIWRRIPITMTGSWSIHVENCSSATLYHSDGTKIDDLTVGADSCFFDDIISQAEDVLLCIRNDTDTLNRIEVTIESPFQVMGLVSKVQAEYKYDGSSLLSLYKPDLSFSLEDLDAHQYYAPSIRTTFDSEHADYEIDLYVDDILIKQWQGTFISPRDKIHDFILFPADVMKFSGFEAGKHSVRIEANGSVTEYSYEVTGTRSLQNIKPEVSSLYLLPDQHVFASFTAGSDGTYTIQSDTPIALQIYGRLTDEDGNVLDNKEEDNEDYDFSLSANLTEGQTVTLEAWFESQKSTANPFFGVVTLIVNEPYAEGFEIFENAKCRALVIGETYETAPEYLTTLTGCKNDADSMEAMLSSLSGSPFMVTKEMNLTAQEILAAIPKVFADATEDDVSLFYYTGHGATGSGSLVGNDGENVSPEALKAALDSVPGTKIILLDSCFSGYLIGRSTPANAEQQAKEALERFVSVFAPKGRSAGQPYYVLTASSLYETSIGYLASCSLFTKNLLVGMGYDESGSKVSAETGPADSDKDGRYTLHELFVYCRNKIRQEELGQTVCPYPYNCDQVLFIDGVPQP